MRQSLTGWAAAVILLIAPATTVLAGQGLEIAGPEIWVDGPAIVQQGTNSQTPDVAVDELGRRIHVWDAFLSSSNPPRNDILMRRFDDAGNPEADPFLVNTYTTNAQKRPRVAAASDGSFLVIWQSSERNLADSADRTWVRSQAFDSDGDPMGSEQLLSTVSPEVPGDNNADVASLRTQDGSPGGFVVAWQSWEPNGTDTGTNIQARRVAANGSPLGGQFQVNNATPGSQRFPTVTEVADGGFLVVWEDAALELVGRRFTAAGSAVGNEFQISTTYNDVHSRPDAAIGWDGRIAVVWEDEQGTPEDNEIRARIYDADLNPLSGDFQVNTYTTGVQEVPRLADYGPKGFLVTWESSGSPGDDASFRSVQARLMTGPNTFQGDQVQYNIWTDTNQHEVGSGGWYGQLGSAWRSNGNSETGNAVVTGRDIDYCMFCDDFEWFQPGGPGNLWRWSSTSGVARPEARPPAE
jgi:hypothetical protein